MFMKPNEKYNNQIVILYRFIEIYLKSANQLRLLLIYIWRYFTI